MAYQGKEIVLITGANVGLGLELARKLLSAHGDRFYCLIGCRTPSKGDAAVKELHGQGLTGCEVLEIEVTKDDSIANAAKVVEKKFGKVDVLHVNAGIALDGEKSPGETSVSKLINQTMSTNVAGAAQTAETFVPLLSKAENPRIIFMSSGLGSLERQAGSGAVNKWPTYAASKSALNMIMLWFSQRFPEWKVNACNPGFRPTALNNYGKTENFTPGKLEDGVFNAVRLTLMGKDGETGTTTSHNDATGEISRVPW